MERGSEVLTAWRILLVVLALVATACEATSPPEPGFGEDPPPTTPGKVRIFWEDEKGPDDQEGILGPNFIALQHESVSELFTIEVGLAITEVSELRSALEAGTLPPLVVKFSRPFACGCRPLTLGVDIDLSEFSVEALVSSVPAIAGQLAEAATNTVGNVLDVVLPGLNLASVGVPPFRLRIGYVAKYAPLEFKVSVVPPTPLGGGSKPLAASMNVQEQPGCAGSAEPNLEALVGYQDRDGGRESGTGLDLGVVLRPSRKPSRWRCFSRRTVRSRSTWPQTRGQCSLYGSHPFRFGPMHQSSQPWPHRSFPRGCISRSVTTI